MTDTAKAAPRCVNCDGIWRAPQHVNKTCDYTIGVLSDEYAALKAVEAAAREAVRIFDTADVFATCDAIEHGVRAALAALDAIRTPDDGKRGGARL